MKLWIKTPYPYDDKGEGVWTECVTPWMKRLWRRYRKSGHLPTAKGRKPDAS